MSTKYIPSIPEPNAMKLWFFLLNYIESVSPIIYGYLTYNTNRGFWISVILRIKNPSKEFPTNNNFG